MANPALPRPASAPPLQQMQKPAIRGLGSKDKPKAMRTKTDSFGTAETIALQLLGFVAADPILGPRFLDLTGLDGPGLRQRAAEPETLAAVLDFVLRHEADMVAGAQAIGVSPEAIAAAARTLGAWPDP